MMDLSDIRAVPARIMDTLAAGMKLQAGPVTDFATPSTVLLDLPTMRLRGYSSSGDGLPILVHAPFAGHDAVIADFHRDQSLMACLREHAGGKLYLTDWKAADDRTKDFGIDEYLAELVVAIDEVGGRAHLVGLCQGGWAVAMVAARWPDKVASLVLAGAPLDLGAGDGAIRRMVDGLPANFYHQLVAMGGGVLRGRFMLQGFKAMHPFEQYVNQYVRLYEHLDDAAYRKRAERFAGWFEHPIDLPGRWYLQAVDQLFRENRFFEGRFAALGRTVGVNDVRCPTYLLAGEHDEITPPAQVLNAKARLGTDGGASARKRFRGAMSACSCRIGPSGRPGRS